VKQRVVKLISVKDLIEEAVSELKLVKIVKILMEVEQIVGKAYEVQ
jgi:hypothetical protein